MSEIKQYDTEVRLEAVMGTNHYGVHIHAMTAENLHSKSDIAVELAWRDLRIEQLIAQLESAQKERDGLREKVNQSDTEWQEMADRILAVGKRAEKAENESGLLAVQLEIATERSGINFDRAQKAEAALSAANEKLSKPVVLPDDGLEDCINMWPDNWRNDFDTGYNFGIWRCEQNIKAAGFTVEE